MTSRLSQLPQLFADAYLNSDEDAQEALAELAQLDPKAIAAHYYFYADTEPDLFGTGIEVYFTITPKIVFDTHACLWDRDMAPVEIILGSDAAEDASSFFSMQYPCTLAQGRALMLAKGFSSSPAFDAFLT